MEIVNSAWFGRMQIFKPKKDEKIGIPYESWHHLAILGEHVIVYVWDTREIVSSFPISKLNLGNFENAKINDSGLQLFIGRSSSEQVKTLVAELLKKYKDLPILQPSESDDISEIKKTAKEYEENIDTEIFDIQDNAKIVFVSNDFVVPKHLQYMFTESETFNPIKRKYADMNSYIGRRRHLATIARCAILNEWKEYNKQEK